MEMEEKYEQALERARELYNAAKVYGFSDDMKRLEYVFPELCENPQQVLKMASSLNRPQFE